MIHLDMRTVVFLAAISYLVCTVFVIQLWRQSRGRFDGINLLAINSVLQTVALTLIVSRGAIPDWVSIFLANVLTMTGAVLSYVGLERFLRKPGPQLHNGLLLVVACFALGIFSLIHPDLPKRTLVVSVFFLIVCAQCVWLLWRRVEPALRLLAFGTGMVFAGYCLLSLVRIAGYFSGATAPGDYFQSTAFNALVIISYQTLLILLTYSLVLMVNRRLVIDIAAQQDKFARAFQLAPYAITMTRLSDGVIVDVNDQFMALSGYDRAEVVGKSPNDLQLWEHDEDRVAVTEALAREGVVAAREINFRTKSGAPVTGLFSANTLPAEGGGHVLSCILDITGSKQTATALLESEARREAAMTAALETQHQGRLAALNLMDDAIAARASAETATAALARLSRLYATLSQSNVAIVRCDSEDALFPQICRDAVNFGGMKMAWIGLVEATVDKVIPVASFGDASDYLANVLISMDAENPRGQGPTATAIREDHPVWCQDFLHDPHTAPWRERGARAGWMASASLPLHRGGAPVGALTLYAGDTNFFDDAIQKLLIEMAADISFAMDSYAAVAERKRAAVKMGEQLDELRRWQQVTLGREGRILAMKQEVNSLLVELGQPPRYTSTVDAEAEKRALP
jgi:PAS domain S-box-containing protein